MTRLEFSSAKTGLSAVDHESYESNTPFLSIEEPVVTLSGPVGCTSQTPPNGRGATASFCADKLTVRGILSAEDVALESLHVLTLREGFELVPAVDPSPSLLEVAPVLGGDMPVVLGEASSNRLSATREVGIGRGSRGLEEGMSFEIGRGGQGSAIVFVSEGLSFEIGRGALESLSFGIGGGALESLSFEIGGGASQSTVAFNDTPDGFSGALEVTVGLGGDELTDPCRVVDDAMDTLRECLSMAGCLGGDEPIWVLSHAPSEPLRE